MAWVLVSNAAGDDIAIKLGVLSSVEDRDIGAALLYPLSMLFTDLSEWSRVMLLKTPESGTLKD